MNIKCLHVITRLANGGAEETVLDLITELATRGIYCDLAVGAECINTVLDRYSLPTQCKIHRIPHLMRSPRPVYELLALQELRSLIRSQQYNIVQTHGSKAGVLGRIAAHKEKVPVVIGMLHGLAFPPRVRKILRGVYKALEKYVAKLSTVLISVGEDLKQTYIDEGIGTEKQYHVIYGMPLEKFSKIALASYDGNVTQRKHDARVAFNLPTDKDCVILGTIARIEDTKNHKELIAMLPHIIAQAPHIHLCIIGDGPYFDAVKAQVEKLGVANHVSFIGYINRIWEILPALDIHCLVSLQEGLPRVFVQTASAGLPNICYQVNGAHEAIKNNESGFVVDSGDRAAFIEKLVYLASNKDVRIAFGKKASEIAESNWSLDTFGKEYSRIISYIVTR